MRLKDYIQSNKRGKDANRMERKALSDPFMQDALDGFDAVAGDHVKIIEKLEKKYANPVITHQSNRKMFLYRSVAAAVLLLIGFGAYLFWERSENDIPIIAQIQQKEIENVVSKDFSELESVQINESQQESLEAVVKAPKAKPASSTASTSIIDKEKDESQRLSENNFAVAEHDDLCEQPQVLLADESSSQNTFGKKEFQTYCQQKADKNVCDGKGVTVKVSFFIDESGKPAQIEYKSFSCEEAKEEIENLLSSSPAWTKTNRKVTITIKW